MNDQQITDTITATLAQLARPDTVEAIAAAAATTGVRGVCKSAEHCIIAELLRAVLGSYTPADLEILPNDDPALAEVTWTAWTAAHDYDYPPEFVARSVPLPDKLNTLAMGFDQGDYPELIAGGAAA